MNTLTYTKKLIITGLCMALCVAFPFAFHAVPNGGNIFSPMHIPALLCGLVCGFQYGALCGLVGPLLSSVITSMPPMAYLPSMMIELFFYGLVSGIMIKVVRTKKPLLNLYISLGVAMLVGRIFAGISKALIFMPGELTIKMWATAYFVTSWPGIVMQIVLIPAVLAALKKAKVI